MNCTTSLCLQATMGITVWMYVFLPSWEFLHILISTRDQMIVCFSWRRGFGFFCSSVLLKPEGVEGSNAFCDCSAKSIALKLGVVSMGCGQKAQSSFKLCDDRSKPPQ
ncbi:hypothetical protein ILYODFUR_012276 [Ilyodon furcidens]|uniref:Secreted protein n=1 Tax=Ilyodon furcidens TaxID=33524 RepID=A0ABV0TU86_9TELE